jgi:hypothetical protein
MRIKALNLPVQTADPKASELSAVFVNCFQLTMLGDRLVRLSFGEQTSPQLPPVYRTAVLLAAEDARQFCQQILTAISATQGRPS